MIPNVTSHSIPHYPSSVIYVHRISHSLPFDASASLFIVHLLPPLEVSSKRAGTRQVPSEHLLQEGVPFPDQATTGSYLDCRNTPTGLPFSRRLSFPSAQGRNSLPQSSSNCYDSSSAPWLPTSILCIPAGLNLCQDKTWLCCSPAEQRWVSLLLTCFT